MPLGLDKIVGRGKAAEFLDSKEEITQVEMPNGHLIPFSSKLSEEEIGVVVREYYDILAETAREQRTSYLLSALVWWVIPCIALYVLGWSTGWVYRGFRQS